MAPVYKIAVVQLHPKPLDIEGNHAAAVKYIRDAARQSIQLAVLPEYHLTSWVPDDPGFVPLCAQYQKYLDSYCALAKELNICIVPGTIVEKHGDDLLNIAYFISSDGSILGSYQKKNLWHPERPHLSSSTHEPQPKKSSTTLRAPDRDPAESTLTWIEMKDVAFDTPLGKVGMLICWDLAFPEAFRGLIAGGAKIIVVPTFWTLGDCSPAGLARNPMAEELFLDSMMTARAFENTCAVVLANAGGPRGDEERGSWAGGSQVAVPFLGALGRLGWKEGCSVVELDMEILEEAEANYKVREDMGREGWHYCYTLTRESHASKA
ncbi:nitrilase [Drepanopeziza brunnea f. sp. 'multigermtubi' MB_m1]|uniref:Nitrilase n=1 Tax=Marssonina brunnea f. sp. multigermtubi (strain MB_m1) TaxID=1072389 RepID=K1X3A6_MARBU|nr:nitrilase [Drepanopeziza brunnea f. sp. 'multigermtubi' MB_m1]EKD15168.1 nitrilase [Drepanopeziza brunnea f. sp. 'multigermtubi' MB_m1]